MKPVIKKVAIGVGCALVLIAGGGGAFAWTQTSAFDNSMANVYDVKPLSLNASKEPEVLSRGKHLVESVGGCAAADCHGADLAGGKAIELGPLGTITGPNITPAGMSGVYSDGELARLLRHGLRKDGTSLRFMPAHEINHLPESELIAIISYLRTVTAVERANGPLALGVLGKILDRQDKIVLDVARRINHSDITLSGTPAPTAEYGRFLALGCIGCHGESFSGGAIPGAPSDIPIPANITPHESGLKAWTYADFDRLLSEGLKKDGNKLDPFMPLDSVGKLNELERKALWAYLQTLKPLEFGNR